MSLIRAIHIAKVAAIATALSLFVLISSTNSSYAVLVDGIISLKAPKSIADIAIVGDGKVITHLSDYHGNYILLNIWATWCTPCVAEMPKLDELQKRYSEAGLKVIALSEDAGGIEQVKRFYAKKNLSLEPYSDFNGIAFKELKVNSLPTSFLINKQGKIVAMIYGDIDWLGDNNIQQIERFLQLKP